MERPKPVFHVQRKPKNFKKSESRALRDKDRMAKHKNKTNLTILEKYYELKFEYGLYNLTPFSPEIETLYEEYVGKVTPISILLASYLEKSVVSNCDTDFSAGIKPSEFIITCDEEDYKVAESNKHSHCFHSYLMNYSNTAAGRCDNCGFRVAECDCVNIIDFSTIFDDSFFVCENQNKWSILPGEIVNEGDEKIEDKKEVKLILPLKNTLYPRMYNINKWPIQLKLFNFRTHINFKLSKESGENFEHFSVLFGDKIPQNYAEYLQIIYLLDCKTRMKIFMNIPIFARLFALQYGRLLDCKTCNVVIKFSEQDRTFLKQKVKLKYCYNKLSWLLGHMNVEQYLYVLQYRKFLSQKNYIKFKKKQYRINSPSSERD